MIWQRKKQVYTCRETYSIRFRTVVSEVSFYQFEFQRLRDFSNKVLEAIFINLQILFTLFKIWVFLNDGVE